MQNRRAFLVKSIVGSSCVVSGASAIAAVSVIDVRTFPPQAPVTSPNPTLQIPSTPPFNNGQPPQGQTGQPFNPQGQPPAGLQVQPSRPLAPPTLIQPMQQQMQPMQQSFVQSPTQSAPVFVDMIDANDELAQNLGYVTDTTRADMRKYPKHENNNMCKNCALFQGRDTDQIGKCPIFTTGYVNNKAWCAGYVKKT